jgi:hypothetical protein
LFKLLVEAKQTGERTAVAFPVSFVSHEERELFAPVVKEEKLVGFAGSASDSLSLSGTYEAH